MALARPPTAHLVYSVPSGHWRLEKLYNRLAQRTSCVPPSYRGGFVAWPSPLKAPASITYHCALALREAGWRVRLYHLLERGRVRLGPHDLLLAHLWPERETVGWQTILGHAASAKGQLHLIGPYNHDAEAVGWLAPAIRRVAQFIAICGAYWSDTWERSPLSSLMGPPTRLDMAVDAAQYPWVKRAFRRPGERRYLYIGNAHRWKNLDQLAAIAAAVPGFEGGYLSIGTIPGWRKIADWAALTPATLRALAADYDIFVNTSLADAQATTVLEMMSAGFPVACTPQTGYTYPSVVRLSTTDTAYNVAQLSALQAMSGEALARLAAENRERVVSQHNWAKFRTQLSAALPAPPPRA